MTCYYSLSLSTIHGTAAARALAAPEGAVCGCGRLSISREFKRLRRLAEIRRKLRQDIPRPQIPTWLWVALTVTPFALFVILLYAAAELLGPRAAGAMVMWTGSSFVAGRWIILSALRPHAVLSVWTTTALAFYLEVGTAVFLIPNVDLLYRVPFLGPRLDQIQLASWEILHANAWLRRLTWFGLVIFVALPAVGTGATGGTFFGRLLGLSRTSTALGVIVGSALGCFLLGLGASFLRRRAETLLAHPLITAAAALLVVLFIVIMGLRLRGSR